MANFLQTKKKLALLHRHPKNRIAETNAAFPYLVEKGIDVLTFKKFNRTGRIWKEIKSFFWIFYAPFLVVGKDYDVIYLDDSYPFYGIFVKFVCPFSKVVKRIGDFHLMYYYSGLAYKILHFFEVIEWKMMDEIIAISDVMAARIYKDMGGPRYPRCVLDPVDTEYFKPDGREDHGTVMFHGVLTRNKNVDILLEAARRMTDIIFIVAGDGPDKERLEKLAPENVVFLGWVPLKNIKDLIANCAIGVALRSNNPGNEYVVTSPFLQYGIMGKPCLVTRRKVFGEYKWQFSTVDEMVEKITYLLDHPEEGEKLRQYVLEHHDAKKIAEEIFEVLIA